MKVKPESLYTSNNLKLNFKRILITGNDETYMDFLLDHYKKKFINEGFGINLEGVSGENRFDKSLFHNKTACILKGASVKNINIVKTFDDENDVLIIVTKNNKEITKLKKEFFQSEVDLLVECYSLTRNSKEVILRDFVKKNNLNIKLDIFCYIIDHFESSFVFFLQQLETVSLTKSGFDNIKNIEEAVFLESKIDINRIFFQVFKKGDILIKIFNKNIFGSQDMYILLNSFKTYLGLIRDSENKDVAKANFPKYLFEEVEVFLKIYQLTNKKKLDKIYNNLWKVETYLRKHSDLYKITGLRFLLNTKKIITS